jgi:dolichol-phosphate mannosyltransferase
VLSVTEVCTGAQAADVVGDTRNKPTPPGVTESAEIDLTVVLPAFNEEASLPTAIDQCIILIQDLIDWTVEVVVVDDGSRDGSEGVLKAFQQDCPWLRVIRHPTNQGYGAALRSGFAASRGRYVFYSDADNQFDLSELKDHVGLMEEFDLVVGFRIYRFDPLTRLVASWFYNRLVRLLFAVRVQDVDCSFKLMRRDRLEQLALVSDDFFIDTEIVARARNGHWRIREVGVRHFPRRAGSTTVRPGDVPRTLRRVTTMWFRINVTERRRKAGISDDEALPGGSHGS